MRVHLLPRVLVAIVAATCLCGCGGNGTINVSGTVTHKGEKVKSGTISFAPVGKESGKPVVAAIKEDGSFTATDVTPGRHLVSFAPSGKAEPIALKPGEKARPAPYAGLAPRMSELDLKAGDKVDIELVARPR